MTTDEIDALVALLSDADRAQALATFPIDEQMAGSPGLCSWWADDQARQLLGQALGASALPPLVYAGQAGATRWPSGTPSKATLASRIGDNHIRGNAGSSTLRLSISAILLRPLGLTVAPGPGLTAGSNRAVSAWMAEHLRVAIVPFPDRDRLAAVKATVVARLDPPLNLADCDQTAARTRLSELRRLVPVG